VGVEIEVNGCATCYVSDEGRNDIPPRVDSPRQSPKSAKFTEHL
jgi:hypothetical protein